MTDELLTIADVAERVGVSYRTVLEWLQRGKLRGSKPGGDKVGWRVWESDLRRFIDSHANMPAS